MASQVESQTQRQLQVHGYSHSDSEPSSSTNFFRSCHVGKDKYSIGDFVFIKEIHQTSDNGFVGRIESFHDKVSRYHTTTVAFVTKFLRQGDVRGLKHDAHELVMDKRETKDGYYTVLAADIQYLCLVKHADDLESTDLTSFYFKSGYNGYRVVPLAKKDIQPLFQYKLTGRKLDVSPQRRNTRQNIIPSTPAVSKKSGPLVDVTSTDNEEGSQSDDMDDIFSESLRRSMRKASKNKDLLNRQSAGSLQHTPNTKRKTRKSSAKVQLIDVENCTPQSGRRRALSANPNRSHHREPVCKESITRQSIADRLEASGSESAARSRHKSAGTDNIKQRGAADTRTSPRKRMADSTDPYHFSSDELSSPRKMRSSVKSRIDDQQNTKSNSKNTFAEKLKATENQPVVLIQRSPTAAAHSMDKAQTSGEGKTPNLVKRNLIESVEYDKKSPNDHSKVETTSKDAGCEKTSTPRKLRSSIHSRAKNNTQNSKKQPQGKLAVSPVKSNVNPSTSPIQSSTTRTSIRLKNRETVTSDGEFTEVTNRAKSQSSSDAESKDENVARRCHGKTEGSGTSTTPRHTRAARSKKSSTSTAAALKSDCYKRLKSANLNLDEEPKSSSIKISTATTNERITRSQRATNNVEEIKEVNINDRTPSKSGSQYNETGDTVLRRSSRKKTLRSKILRDASLSDMEALSDSDEDEEIFSGDCQSSSEEEFQPVRHSRHSELRRQQSTTSRSPRRKSVATPSRRSILNACTPSRRERQNPVKEYSTALEKARAELHVSAVPDSLPCREEEFANIYSYVESKLESGTGGCLYISGVSGTGKTATVYEVIKCLNLNKSDEGIPDFKFVEINGMRLTQPHQAFVQIYKQLSGKQATAEHATSLLDDMFSKSRRQNRVVLLVDELDLLLTRKQDVLYNIFDWPTKPHSRLIVLAIANTMDLPERVMMSRVSSRLGLNRMTFLPYTFQQLQEIVHSRLSGIPAFDADAIQLASRKAASASGDARRALAICRRSAEVAEQSGAKVVTMLHVNLALQEMFNSPMITAIRNCCFYEKIVLKAIAAEFTRSGLEEATLYQVYHIVADLCGMEKMPTLKMMQVNQICCTLSNTRLILLENNSNGIYQRLRLNVAQDDLQYALQHEEQ